MKKFNIVTILTMIFISINAAELINDGYYEFDKIPEKAEISLPLKKDFEFKLEENATTGYIWQARYNPAEAEIEIEHKGNNKNKLVSSPGYAEIEIELLKNQTTVIEFYYSRPFEKNTKILKSMTCIINPITKTTETIKEKVTDNSLLPVLKDDTYLKLKNMPNAMQITLPIGKDISFSLEEDDRNLRFWNIVSQANNIAEIEIEHEESGLFFNNSHAEIELEPKKSGTYKLELVYAKETPFEKHFTLHITIQ